MLPLVVLLAAAPVRVAVLPIIVEREDAAVSASELRGAVADAARGREGIEVVASLETSCGADDACYAGELAMQGVEAGLLVVVNELGAQPLIALRLIDVAEKRAKAVSSAVLEAREGSIADAVRARTERIFDEVGWRRPAELVAAAPAESSGSSSWTDSPWFWAVTAGVVAVAAVGIVAIAMPKRCICVAPPGESCPEC